MKISFVVLLLVFMGLMYTVQAEDLTEGHRDPPPPPPKPSGSEKCVATLAILAVTFGTVFYLQRTGFVSA